MFFFLFLGEVSQQNHPNLLDVALASIHSRLIANGLLKNGTSMNEMNSHPKQQKKIGMHF
jgi:hypothetical protein